MKKSMQIAFWLWGCFWPLTGRMQRNGSGRRCRLRRKEEMQKERDVRERDPEKIYLENLRGADTGQGDVTQEIFGQSKHHDQYLGTFCGPCIQEMPDLGEISRSYDSGNFR